MNWKKSILTVLRLVLAATFIFSGFVKAADPWGTAIKLGEYFSAFGWGRPGDLVFGLSVLLSGAEMALGLALLFAVRLRLTGLLAFLFMTGMTGLTFWIAMTDPVADCGCFGDAVKLTNWETVLKNLILWPMSAIVWLVALNCRRGTGEGKDSIDPAVIYARSLGGNCAGNGSGREPSAWKDALWLGLMLVLSCSVGIYSLLHLPLIDFLPFKVGTNIPAAMQAPGGGESRTTLVYRDKLDGSEREFTLEDTTWYDTARWEYVDTRIETDGTAETPAIREFAVFNRNKDITSRILDDPGRVTLVCVTDPKMLPAGCAAALSRVAARAQGAGEQVLCVTPSSLEGESVLRFGDGVRIPCYNIDGTTLKTMLRARNGIVVLEGGTVMEKRNCRDLR